MRRSCHLLLLIAATAGSAAAQAPIVIPPTGTLKIELRGDFTPASEEMVDGARRELGSPLSIAAMTPSTFPVMADLASRLRPIIGNDVGGSMGSLVTIGEFQRGVGTIGLALGIKPWASLWADIPIVSVRSQFKLTHDPTDATVGINPVLLGAGSASFLTQFDAALTSLDNAIAAGEYQHDPALLQLAQATAASAPGLRNSLGALLSDGPGMPPVLPLAGSPEGAAILDLVTELQTTFGDQLGIPGFTSMPTLPTSPLNQGQFNSLLFEESSFNLRPFDDPPLVGLGDISLGATVRLYQQSAASRSLTLWGTVATRLPTGTAPADGLRDQGTGTALRSASGSILAELSTGRIAVRGEARYEQSFAGTRTVRVGDRDEYLLPVSRELPMRLREGSAFSLSVQPFWRIVDRLALTGRATHWRRGDQSWTTQASLPEWWTGGDPTRIGQGTGADATTVGLGLAYSHDGNHRDGGGRMPVEAGLMVERTVASGSGIVPLLLTSRVYFRVYKSVFGR